MAIHSADDEELEPEDFARAGPHRPNRPAKDAGSDPGGDHREAEGADRDAAAGERLPPPNTEAGTTSPAIKIPVDERFEII